MNTFILDISGREFISDLIKQGKLRPINNLVYIKLDYVNNKYKFAGGASIDIDESFDPGFHAQRWGTIAAIPEQLNYNKMDWVTSIDIKPGDKVFFDYLNGLTAQKENKIQCNDCMYIPLEYKYLYAKKYENGIKMLNGYCIMKQIEEHVSDLAINNKTFKRQEGVLTYVSDPIEFIGKKSKMYSDPGELKVGMHILHDKKYLYPMEQDMWATENDKEMFLIHRRNIIGILED